MKFEFLIEDKTKKLTDEAHADLVAAIPTNFDKWNDDRGQQLEDTKTIRDRIYQKNIYRSDEWQSQIRLPDIYELAQTLKAHLWENIYQNPDGMFDVSGRTQETEVFAPAQKTMLVNAFENMKIRFELDKAINDLIETGDAVLFVGWETRTKQVRRKSQNLGLCHHEARVARGKGERVARVKGIDVHSRDDAEWAGSYRQETLPTSEIDVGCALRTEVDTLQASKDLLPTGENSESRVGLDPPSMLGGLKSHSAKEKFVIETKTIFDGVKVKAISPESFVFDKAKKNNWDSCPKVYQSWATFDEIQSNKVYTLDEETKLTLKSLESNDKSSDSAKVVRGDQIEILEYWGDIKLNDGTLLRNWLVTIAGRCKIIRFEGNPYVINPFITASLIEDPDTKRGISPLKIALVLNEISSDILNSQLNALSLIINPPYLAPKGCFTGKQEVSPGKIIEYEAALMPKEPIPLNFQSALQGWEFINFFKSTTETSTGIFRNMAGATDPASRTATEIHAAVGGQSIRLTMAVDNINQRIIIPMVELVADLISNYKFGTETVPARVKGRIHYVEINDAIRQGDYKYTYGDRTVTQEKKLKFKELFDIVSAFSKIPEIENKIDWMECFKYALEQYGIENPDQFLRKEMPFPMPIIQQGQNPFSGQVG